MIYITIILTDVKILHSKLFRCPGRRVTTKWGPDTAKQVHMNVKVFCGGIKRQSPPLSLD